MSDVRVVVFDVGETLIDESRLWRAWAEWLGVSPFTFFVAMGMFFVLFGLMYVL